jgi:acylphosphatase
MPVIRIRVTGRVQGVGFRWFVRERAVELGVAGWVKNLPDGDVELVAQGAASQLASLESIVSRGPPGAHVAAVHHLPTTTGTSYPDPFAIER